MGKCYLPFMDFSRRSYKKELLDRDDIPFEDIKRNMEELEFINSHLGGHNITIKGIRSLIKGWEQLKATGNNLVICEIGCGGGDNLKAIEKWCKAKDIQIRFIGIDIKKNCIVYASENCRHLNAEWITSDYRSITFHENPDIIFSSLFCHHFSDEEVVRILEWMKINSRIGFFINDLHRHPVAYYSIKLLTTIFSRSYLVKNDAPLSVKRGFKKMELESLLQRSHINDYEIHWKWAFRWLITINAQTP